MTVHNDSETPVGPAPPWSRLRSCSFAFASGPVASQRRHRKTGTKPRLQTPWGLKMARRRIVDLV